VGAPGGTSGVRGTTILNGLLATTVAATVLGPGCAPAPWSAAPPAAAVLVEPAAVGEAAPAAGRPQLPQLVPVDLEFGRRLQRAGETERARQVFELLLERRPDQAAAARLQLAQLALDDGQPQQAADQLRAVVDGPASPAERAAARYLLGYVLAQQGATDAAIQQFEAYLASSDLLAANAALALADLYRAASAPARAAAAAERALGASPSRRVRIEALERLATLAAERGDLAAAQQRWETILPLAATDSYRAEVLWQLAALARQRGQLDAAVDRYRALVVDYPGTPRARQALDALNELGRTAVISDYQAGLVRYLQGDYARALAGFEAQLAAGGTAEEELRASYYRALSLLRLGRTEAALDALAAFATRFADAPLAAEALYRRARLIEEEDRASAVEAYRALAATYPDSDPAYLAALRAGLALYRDGRAAEAMATWEAALPALEPRRVRDPVQGVALNARAGVLFWLGKALVGQGRAAEARARWQEAAAVDPDDFYGLRARAALDGADSPRPADLSRPLASAEVAALDTWLARLGAEREALAAELAAEPLWQRGAALWNLGRRQEAEWEFDDLRARFADDPAHLYGLAAALADLGADALALRVAERVPAASGAATVDDLPAAVQRLLYPAPYAELVARHAERRGLDPLLLLALIRQESAFDPRAESPAHARGLTQIVPSTGRDIARALGREGFDERELFKPAVSIEFGAYYLATALRQAGGDLYVALAGYNAGPGVAARWRQQLAVLDPDLYVEQIPYAETSAYVRKVYAGYRRYRALYGS